MCTAWSLILCSCVNLSASVAHMMRLWVSYECIVCSFKILIILNWILKKDKLCWTTQIWLIKFDSAFELIKALVLMRLLKLWTSMLKISKRVCCVVLIFRITVTSNTLINLFLTCWLCQTFCLSCILCSNSECYVCQCYDTCIICLCHQNSFASALWRILIDCLIL